MLIFINISSFLQTVHSTLTNRYSCSLWKIEKYHVLIEEVHTYSLQFHFLDLCFFCKFSDKAYSWCLCGKSKNQPICDGMHKDIFLKIKLRPIRFKVEKTGDYWLCNCKQTKHRPFCDGTHKQKHIQEAVK